MAEWNLRYILQEREARIHVGHITESNNEDKFPLNER